MSSGDPRAGRIARLFPPALIAAIRDGDAPGRAAVLATARHLKRDLAALNPDRLSRRMAVRLGYRAIAGGRAR